MAENEENKDVAEEEATIENQEVDSGKEEAEGKEAETTEENKDEVSTDDETKEEESTEDESDEEAGEESDYNSYENPALKQAVTLLKEANLPVAEANAIFAEAVESGDLSKINKDALIEKVGADKAAIVLVLAESYYNTAFSEMKAIKEGAFEITGGEENFNAMREWAGEKVKTDKAFAKDMNEFRTMLDSKQPRAIKAAIRELFDLYRQDPDTTIEANLEVGDAAVNKSGIEPLSREDYTKEISKAHRNGTYDKVSASLWARRKAGIKQNI